MSGFLAAMNQRRWAVLGAIAAGVVVLVVINLVLVDDPAPRRAAERCDPGDLYCYEGRYAQLVKDAGPERAFRAFRADYERDPLVRAKCHGLTHAIGRAAGERFGDVAEAYRRGDRFCGSGYYHGALEAIVADPAGSRALDRPDDVCTGLRPRSVDQRNCSHGLGHGFMVVRANDLPASLQLCDRLSAGSQRSHCYDGVFMENVLSEDDPRHPSRYLDPNRPLRLCSALGARYRGSCLERQVLYALEVTRGDFPTIFDLCRRLGPSARPPCDRLLGEAAADVNIMNQPDLAAQARATAQLCGVAPDAGARLRCAEGAIGFFVFHYARAAEAKVFCRELGSLRRRCARVADELVREARGRGPRS